MKILRKAGAATIILFVLFTQIHSNLPQTSLATASFENKEIASVYWLAVEKPIWRLKYLSWILGLSTKWRMFSPPDMRNWQFFFYGVDQQGLIEPILRPTQEERNFWQRNFTDFREVKFELNIYGKSTEQNYFAQHLCNNALQVGKRYSHIEMYLEFSEFQNLAKKSTAKPEPIVRTHWGKFRCLPLLPVS